MVVQISGVCGGSLLDSSYRVEGRGHMTVLESDWLLGSRSFQIEAADDGAVKTAVRSRERPVRKHCKCCIFVCICVCL